MISFRTIEAQQDQMSWRHWLLAATCLLIVAAPAAFAADPPGPPKSHLKGIKVGTFAAEIGEVTTTSDGLPSDDVWSVAVLPNKVAYCGTAKGLARWDGKKWEAIPSVADGVKLLAPHHGGVVAVAGDRLYLVHDLKSEVIAELPLGLRKLDDLHSLAASGNTIWLGTRDGLFQCFEQPNPIQGQGHRRPSEAVRGGMFEFQKQNFQDSFNGLPNWEQDVRQVAAADGRVAVATSGGLYVRDMRRGWQRQNPIAGDRSWLPRDVRGVAFDAKGRLWFACPAGVGCLDGTRWTLYTKYEGLPYDDFTTMAAGENGAVWFGTKIGAIRFDGAHWNYRASRRWLPDDNVRAIAVGPQGDAWFATEKGAGRIERQPMTLAKKATLFEEAIDKFHRRTPHGYVLDVNLEKSGDTSHFTQHDSDNDGLWTAMYGAGECFAYAATKDPEAKQRAKAAFEGLRFLSQVTQGGEHPAPKGFPARSILPTSGPDPNIHDSVEHDEEQHEREPLWKVMSPRWPKSADGKWYWKSDTSSDELDGHYFMYAVYYDLVAETEAEKAEVRQVVADITTHLLEHDYNLVDHDGKPTRWARFGPNTLNQVQWALGRGLNSLSILSYLMVADHVTKDPKYKKAFDGLVKDHGYLANMVFAKGNLGAGTGNQSDDEMAFMSYYTLLKYSTDRDVRRAANMSLREYWLLEEREANPLFNYIFAASYTGRSRFGPAVPEECLVDAADTLERFPLNRFDWGFKNSIRIDIVPIYRGGRGYSRVPRSGYLRTTGKTVPVDERFVDHWNHDPWILDERGAGHGLADGASYLLPYYMGRYFGFVIEPQSTNKGNGVEPESAKNGIKPQAAKKVAVGDPLDLSEE